MRRSLVIDDETAGHPFRRSLPRHVRYGSAPDFRKARRRRRGLQPVLLARRLWRGRARRNPVTLQDVKDFLLAYCACFVAVMAFIS